MKRLFGILISSFFFIMLSAQNYNHLWEQVEKASQNDLPRQALEQVQAIHEKAVSERNDAQLLKSHLALIHYNFEISRDSILPYTRRMIAAMEREKRPLQRSLWHSALAQLYEQKVYAFVLNGQSYEEVKALAVEQYEASLAEPEVLMAMSYKTFLPLFEQRKDSRYFNDDCLHVLYQAYQQSDFISRRDKKQCIERIKSLYARYANQNAVTLLTLDAIDLNHPSRNVRGALENHPYYQQLLQLYQSCRQLPVSLFVLTRMASLYSSSYADKSDEQYNADNNNRNDSVLYDWAEQALNNPLYKDDKEGLAYMETLRSEINAPTVFIPGLQHEYYPSDVVTLSVMNRNVELLTFRIIPCFDDCAEYDYASEDTRRRIIRRHRDIAKIYEYMPIGTPRHWGKFTLNMRVPAKPGVYELEVLVNNKKVESRSFKVTAIAPLVFNVNRHQHRLLVVDRKSGLPVRQARVRAFDAWQKRLLHNYKTIDGELSLAPSDKHFDDVNYYVNTPGDFGSSPCSISESFGYYTPRTPKHRTIVDLFTDRAIYRPGQTVYFSGVAYTKEEDDHRVDSMLSGQVFLLDSQRKKLDTLAVRTDAFGTFHGSFQLPEDGMNGSFQLLFKSDAKVEGSLRFRVEEYKRPTLQVRMLDIKEAYRLNDTVTVEGVAETFSGLPVADALVVYQVSHSSWWFQSGDNDTQNGELRTDEQGHFKFRIKLAATDEQPWFRGFNCHFFHVNCSVTAENGETAEGETLFRAQTRRAYFEADVPDIICKEYLPDCAVRLLNASGEELHDTVRCQLWQGDSIVLTRQLQAGSPFRLSNGQTLPSGRYRLVLHTDDDVEDFTKDFCLFSSHDRQIPDVTAPFFAYQHVSAEGDSVVAYVGTSAPNALLYYHVVSSDSLIESRRIPLSRNLLRLELDYRADFGDAATASLALVRDNRLHTFSYTVRKPLPDKRLKLTWTTFRSKLTPGQHEEWRLRITRPDGTPAQASLMACLYDASLDQLATQKWDFSSVYIYRRLPPCGWARQGFSTEYGSGVLQGITTDGLPYRSPAPLLTVWKDDLFGPVRRYARMADSNACAPMDGEFGAFSQQSDRLLMCKSAVAYKAESAEDEAAPAAPNAAPEVKVRSNFAETAFFQPALRTDSDGQVSIAFTLPESMTQWKFCALAHDGQMNNGSLRATVLARKEFMVQPAMPRFLRHGDRTVLPVTVTNLTDRPAEFSLTLTVEHGIKQGQILKDFTRQVTLSAEQQKVVEFDFPVNFDAPCVICRVVAQGDDFSDGEEHLLSIQSEKVEVTRTLPFSLRQPGTFTVDIPDWLHTKHISQPVLGIELTSNPLWYTLSALPLLAEDKDRLTASDWATAFYAVELGARIAELNPQLRRTVEHFGEELQQAYLPRLAKLDDCTPWMDRAQNEAQRIHNLQKLLDKNETARQKGRILKSLKLLQRPDGGWSWCPGMQSNIWTTLEVSILLARVQLLTNHDEGAPMLRKAYAYLRKKMAESVDDMKRLENKYKDKMPVQESHLQYLYLTVLMGEKPHEHDLFLLERAAGLRKELTMYGKAVAARVLAETGYEAESQMTLQSLLEYTTMDGMNGRFFDNPRAFSCASSYLIPTQCATIETLQYFGRDIEAEEMMLWLLQAKRTQMWDTPRSSTDAIYTLLAAGGMKNPLTSLDEKEPLAYTLYQADKPLAASTAEATENRHTTGYIRDAFTDETTLQADRLEVSKSSEGLSWGSVYATFRQPETEVVQSGSGFDLTYTIEVFDDGQWEKFRFGKPLHKGQRIRRVYTLKAERDYDFVKLRADRPACFVPRQTLSGYHWFDRFSAYEMVRDQATEFYIEHLDKGTYRFTEEFFVDRSGFYATGISRISCLQAPEYTAVTPSIWLHVE